MAIGRRDVPLSTKSQHCVRRLSPSNAPLNFCTPDITGTNISLSRLDLVGNIVSLPAPVKNRLS
jgi:hypothetical protein